jgi:hypothetical protein
MTIEALIEALASAETMDEILDAVLLVPVDTAKLDEASKTPQKTIGPDTATRILIGAGMPAEVVPAYLDAMGRWHAMDKHQRAVEAAFEEAQGLMSALGKDHPKTMAAVIRAVELRDPGVCARKAKECGLDLPEPDYRDDDGRALYSSHAVAEALDMPHEQVLDEIEALGIETAAPAGAVHRVQ